MLDNIRLKAVVLGALVGFVMPYFIAFWFKVSVLGDIKQPHVEGPIHDYTLAWVFLYGIGPLLGGAVAANLSRAQPILNAVFAALLGWLFYSIGGAGVLSGLVLLGVGSTGAVIWRSIRK